MSRAMVGAGAARLVPRIVGMSLVREMATTGTEQEPVLRAPLARRLLSCPGCRPS